MIIYPKINPVMFQIANIKFNWYGFMYALSFVYMNLVSKWRIKHYGHPFMTIQLMDDYTIYGALGTILGGRIGYFILYKPMLVFTDPLSIFKVWMGGMSFHGGLIGVMLSMYLFTRKINKNFFGLCDLIAINIPVCLFLGRMGNFINGELWGRVSTSDVPWLTMYPGSSELRHPSVIYEALGEGVIFYIIMLIYANSPRRMGQISGMFAISYSIIRFFIEFFREPDSFALWIPQATGLTLGQIYCIPLCLTGVCFFMYARKNPMPKSHI